MTARAAELEDAAFMLVGALLGESRVAQRETLTDLQAAPDADSRALVRQLARAGVELGRLAEDVGECLPAERAGEKRTRRRGAARRQGGTKP